MDVAPPGVDSPGGHSLSAGDADRGRDRGRASLWLTMTQLGFRTSRAELLNPKSDYNRRWLEYTKEFGDKEDVVVVVEGDSREQVVPAVDEVCRELAQRADLFSAVLHETDAPKLRSKGLYYLDARSDLRQIDGFLEPGRADAAGRLVAAESRHHGAVEAAAMPAGPGPTPPNPGRHANRIAARDARDSSRARAAGG